MKQKEIKFKKLYDRKCKIAAINSDLSIRLDKMIESFLGRDLDSFELDFAVDTLNEGTGSLSFEDFIIELRKLKKEMI